MNKTILIFSHEFWRTIRRTGFIILTLALPVLALLAIGVFHIISGVTSTKPAAEVTKIGYVDQAGGFEQFTTQGNITFVLFDNQGAANQALTTKSVKEYFVIPQDFVATGIVQRFVIQKEFAPAPGTIAAIQNFLSGNLLAEKVPPQIISRVMPVPIRFLKLNS